MKEGVCVNAFCSGLCPACVCSPSREEDKFEDDVSLTDQNDRDEMVGEVRIDLSAQGMYVFSVQ